MNSFSKPTSLTSFQANGGEVVPLEKQADVKIVDHARKEALPGTYVAPVSNWRHWGLGSDLINNYSHSYTFIEKSLRNGDLEDLEDHRVGASEGTVRSVGSIVQPAKGTRNKYTEADDRILWGWVQENPQKGGGTDGNEIYKQLETKVRESIPIHRYTLITEVLFSIPNTLGNPGETALSNI